MFIFFLYVVECIDVVYGRWWDDGVEFKFDVFYMCVDDGGIVFVLVVESMVEIVGDGIVLVWFGVVE